MRLAIARMAWLSLGQSLLVRLKRPSQFPSGFLVCISIYDELHQQKESI
jgi:hypothetical protein